MGTFSRKLFDEHSRKIFSKNYSTNILYKMIANPLTNPVQDKFEENTEAKLDSETDLNSSINNDEDYMYDDEDLEAIKARVREMELEADKLKQEEASIDKNANIALSTSKIPSMEEKAEIDARSCFIGNVDYSASAEELETHFKGCGGIERVTILCNKFNGSPKGFAYIEFADKSSVETAMALNDSLFKGRQLKVMLKRTNKPGIHAYSRPPFHRGRGFRGRISGYRGRGGYRYPRRAGYRGRYFSPY